MATNATSLNPFLDVRSRISSVIKTTPDRECKTLLKDLLRYLSQPYDIDKLVSDHRLSPKESIILRSLIRGHSPRQISNETGTAISTVRKQIHDIHKKMQVSGNAELLAKVLRSTYV
jgi:DNA-binding CsgD family transcriptional regulator